MSTHFIVLMSVLISGFAIVIFLVWKVGRYIRNHRNLLMKSAVTKTKGRILHKSFGGGDARFSGTPHMVFQITIDEKTIEVEKKVDKDLFFSYEEGDLIDLFVAEGADMMVYPLDSLIEKPECTSMKSEREPITA